MQNAWCLSAITDDELFRFIANQVMNEAGWYGGALPDVAVAFPEVHASICGGD